MGKIHTHTGGELNHSHGQLLLKLQQVPEVSVDTVPDLAEGKVLHTHDAVTSPTLLPINMLSAGFGFVSAQVKIYFHYVSHPSAIPDPLYRPPIV